MQKSKKLISILLICSFLMSAWAPVLQVPEYEQPEIEEVNNEVVNELGNQENDPVVEIPVQNMVPADPVPEMGNPENNEIVTSDPVTTEPQNTDVVDNTPTETPAEVTPVQSTDVIVPSETPDATLPSENSEQQASPDVPGDPAVQDTLATDPTNAPQNPTEEITAVPELTGTPESENSEQQETEMDVDPEAANQMPVLNVTEFIHKQNTSDFRVIVSNMGNVDFSNVVVKFKTPSYSLNGASESINTSGGYVSVNTLPVEVEGNEYVIGDMEPGKVIEIVYHANVPEGFSSAIVVSSVEAKGEYLTVAEDGTEAAAVIESSSSASAYILGENPHYAEIGVSLVDSKDGFYFPGESILHQVVVSNNSEFSMDNISVSYNGLSASGYEDIPCVFTRVCDINGCEAIPTELQDSNYKLGELGSADMDNHSVLLFCENGVNDVYYENVSYTGRVNVTGNVLANDMYAPANSTVETTSNSVNVEVMIPMALSASPMMALQSAPVVPDEIVTENEILDDEILNKEANELMEPEKINLDSEPVDNMQKLSLTAAPRLLAAGNSTSQLILRADCMNGNCIANTDRTKSFYVSLCNDGDVSYNSVKLSTASGTTGNFKRYFYIPLSSYTGNGGYSEKNPVSASGTSINTGALAGNTCVVAVFEATFSDPPADYTSSKDFKFSVNADNQTGTVTVSVSGCYVPTTNANIGLDITPITKCVDSDAATTTHTMYVENNGTAKLCNVKVTANKPGKFKYLNTTTSSNTFTYSGEFSGDSYFNLTFEQNLSNETLNEGSTQSVVFTTTATDCGSKSLKATGQSTFTVCKNPTPSITVTPPVSTTCVDINEQGTATFTIKNDGEVAFCKIDGEFQVKKNGTVVSRKEVNLSSGLSIGGTANVSFQYKPASAGVQEGESYEVHLITNAYTTKNGTCSNLAKSNIDRKVDMTACKTSLTNDGGNSGSCMDANASQEVSFTLKNNGEVNFCKIDGEFQVKKGNTIVGRQTATVQAGLAVGKSTTVKYTFTPSSLGIKENESFEVHFVANGYTSVNGSCSAMPVSGIDSKVNKSTCKTGLTVTPPSSGTCLDVNVPQEVTFTVKNDGQIDFCKIDGEFQVKKGNSVVGRQAITVNSALAAGKSTTVKYTFNPASIGLKEGDAFEVHFVANGYTSVNGSCSAKTQSGIDGKVDKTACKTALVVTPPSSGTCVDINNPQEVTFTVKNNGQIDFCKIDGEFQVKKGNSVVGRQAVTVNSALAVGKSTTVKYTLNAANLGLKEGDAFEIHFVANGYTSVNGSCSAKPQSGIDSKVDKTACKTALTVTPPSSGTCLDVNAPQEVTFTVKNDGQIDFCKIDGEFQVKKGNSVIGRQAASVNSTLAAGKSTTVKYTINPASLGLKEGDEFEVHFVANSYTSVSGTCNAKVQSGVDNKVSKTACKTKLVITPPSSGTCIDINTPQDITFTVKNDGQIDFCKIDGEFQVKKGNTVIGKQAVTVDAGLAAGKSTTVKYTLNAAKLGLKEGDAFEIHFVGNGYTSVNGSCTAKPQSGIDSKVDKTACKTGLTVTPPKSTDCTDLNTPEEMTFTIKNTGEVDYCKIDGEFQVVKDGKVIGKQTVNINSGLAAGKSANVKYTLNAASLGLKSEDQFEVRLVANGYTSNGSACSVKSASDITGKVDKNICVVLIPSITVEPKDDDECHDMNEPETVEYTITNNGEVSFCKVEGEFRVVKDGKTLDTKAVTITTKLDPGKSVTATYTVDAKALGLNAGESYEVYLVVDGYTEKDGACTEKPLDPVEEKVVNELCEKPVPSITVTPKDDDECHDMDEPETVEFTVTNNGEATFCKVEGEFRVVKDGKTLDTKAVTITTKLDPGKSVTATYTVDAKALGLNAGESYEVYLVVDGYTEKDGACTEKPLDPVEEKVVNELCEKPVPSITVTPPDNEGCQEMDEPEVLNFVVVNDGQQDFCLIKGKFVITSNGQKVGEKVIEIKSSVTTPALKINEQKTLQLTVDPDELGLSARDQYEIEWVITSYVSEGDVCSETPANTKDGKITGKICEPYNPSLIIEADEKDGCQKMDEPEVTVFTVTNNGENDFCVIDATVQVIVGNRVIDTKHIQIDTGLKVNESTQIKYTVDPDALGLDAGDKYKVKLTVSGTTLKDGVCSEIPSEPYTKIVERNLCEDVKPVINVINLNNECINAGDTLKFKGEINLDEFSAAKSINITTGKIDWGGSHYDCTITSIKENSDEGYRVLDDDEKSTSWTYTVTEKGDGVLGFICEAATHPNEQMRNGRQLRFETDAVVSTNSNEYTVRSNRLSDPQKCPITRTVSLPHTGDDTNLQLLIGVFSLFVITGAGASIFLAKKKKDGSNN